VMADQLVSVTSQPYQYLTAQLEVDGQALTLNLVVYWHYMSGYWLVDVYAAQGDLLLSGVPLITGAYPAANLLGQQVYLSIGAAVIINQSSGQQDYPGINTLGSQFSLLWGDTP